MLLGVPMTMVRLLTVLETWPAGLSSQGWLMEGRERVAFLSGLLVMEEGTMTIATVMVTRTPFGPCQSLVLQRMD